MTQRIVITAGSEAKEIADARFEAWLAIERERVLQYIQQDVSEKNCERERLNALSADERRKFNQRRRRAGEKPVSWPLKPISPPLWNDSMLSVHKLEIARIACAMTRAELGDLKAEFARKNSAISSENFQDIQHAFVVWEYGESKRDEHSRLNAARQKALGIIAKRKQATDMNWSVEECFGSYGPEGGGFHGDSEWRPELWDELPSGQKEALRQRWERVERLLPVYYEYARQSVDLLQLAAMHEAIEQEMPRKKAVPARENDKPRLGGCAMHPLELMTRRKIRELHGRIGGYAQALIQSLGRFLVQDMPYARIPLEQRKWAADFAMQCNEHHYFMGPDLSDAGPVLDPWVIGQVERERVRLATVKEATRTEHIHYNVTIAREVHGIKVHHEDVIPFERALNATTRDQEVRSKRTNKQGHFRALDADGGEVLALKVVWKDTRDSELAEAFLQLIKRLRPRRPVAGDSYRALPEAEWPERPAKNKRGSKWQAESLAALRSLARLHELQSAKNSLLAARDEGRRLKQRLKGEKLTAKEQAAVEAAIKKASIQEGALGRDVKRLALSGAKLAIINDCFQKVVGGDETPWWKKRL